MINKTIFFFVFNLFSPQPEKYTSVSPKKRLSDLNLSAKELDEFILKIDEQFAMYSNEINHLQNNFTALKEDYKDDIHELREDLRQAKNKKLNPWVKGIIIVSGTLALFLLFWFARIYHQLFWT